MRYGSAHDDGARSPMRRLALGLVCLLVGIGAVATPHGVCSERPFPRSQNIGAGVPNKPPVADAEPERRAVSTFSIVAYDPDREEWGIGVASRFLAVGSVVPWARADAGAIATQSFANTTYGPQGLKLLQQGKSAEEVLKLLLEADEGRERRQVGIVDLEGNVAHFTGEKCHPWAGAKAGKHYTCQGNILAGPEVVDAMASAFEKEPGPLSWRIMAALEAGEEQGGDVRGKQAAAILVVRAGSGYGGFNDRMIDLRVDDHAEPIQELARILALKVKRENAQP
jgi:uncharacterized Ntn-hydrolase superfamily protein